MDHERLSDDTALCLSASALRAELKLTRAQRELLKAVAHSERVTDIVRRSRLPERYAKRELLTLLEAGLIMPLDADAEEHDAFAVPFAILEADVEEGIEEVIEEVDAPPIEQGPAANTSAGASRPLLESYSDEVGQRPSHVAPVDAGRGDEHDTGTHRIDGAMPSAAPLHGAAAILVAPGPVARRRTVTRPELNAARSPNAVNAPRLDAIADEDLDAAFERLSRGPTNQRGGDEKPRSSDKRPPRADAAAGGNSKPIAAHPIARLKPQQMVRPRQPSQTDAPKPDVVEAPTLTEEQRAFRQTRMPSTLPNGTPGVKSIPLPPPLGFANASAIDATPVKAPNHKSTIPEFAQSPANAERSSNEGYADQAPSTVRVGSAPDEALQPSSRGERLKPGQYSLVPATPRVNASHTLPPQTPKIDPALLRGTLSLTEVGSFTNATKAAAGDVDRPLDAALEADATGTASSHTVASNTVASNTAASDDRVPGRARQQRTAVSGTLPIIDDTDPTRPDQPAFGEHAPSPPRQSSIDELRRSSDRPPPLVSDFAALKPLAETAQGAVAVGADSVAGGTPAIQRVRVPLPQDRSKSAEPVIETIPLVTVVRQPVVTLGKPRDIGRTGDGSSDGGRSNVKRSLSPMQVINAGSRSGQSSAAIGPGEQPAVRLEPSEARSSDPLPAKGGGTLAGMTRPKHDSTRPLGSPKSESSGTIEGMPAAASHERGERNSDNVSSSGTLESLPAVDAQPPDRGANNLGATLLGGLHVDPDKRRTRPAVVVRSGAPPERTSDSPKPDSMRPTGPTGQTLHGVLAPTPEQLAGEVANDLTAPREQNTSSSVTLPSLRAQGIKDALQASPIDITRVGWSVSTARSSDENLDHYEVLECLAKGGSGVVYKVRDPRASADEFMALKVLRQGTHKSEEAVAALTQEANLMGTFDHPNLVRLHHFGQENGEPFLLMEYVDGLSMSDLLHHPVPLPLDVGLIIIQDALDALDYIHNVRQPESLPSGLVHCDVSPQNLLVGSDGVTRLIDFGTSRAPGDHIGEAGVRCKPRYASPEMMSGGEVWPESDIFSMGAVLFQLLSKQPAFSADPRRRKRESLVPNPSMLNRRAPTPFDPICQRALDPDSTRRFHSAREMLEALDLAVETSGIELRRLRVNFWVRRVIQSRHGDVEFDINELEDLLGSKPSSSGGFVKSDKDTRRSASLGANTDSAKQWTSPPPTVTLALPRVDASSSSDEHAAASPASRDGSIGAASKFREGLHDESNLSPVARRLITSAMVGIVVALLAFALAAPDRFRAIFTVKTGEALSPTPPPSAPTPPAQPTAAAVPILPSPIAPASPPTGVDLASSSVEAQPSIAPKSEAAPTAPKIESQQKANPESATKQSPAPIHPKAPAAAKAPRTPSAPPSKPEPATETRRGTSSPNDSPRQDRPTASPQSPVTPPPSASPPKDVAGTPPADAIPLEPPTPRTERRSGTAPTLPVSP